MKRADLLNLIHSSEQEHQSYIEALNGLDPYRTARTHPLAKVLAGDVFELGCEAGSRSNELRSILERWDKAHKMKED